MTVIANPKRGCGHLKEDAFYLRGLADPEWVTDLALEGKIHVVEIGPEENGDTNIEDFDEEGEK